MNNMPLPQKIARMDTERLRAYRENLGSAPDISGLSPQEKILLGLSRK